VLITKVDRIKEFIRKNEISCFIAGTFAISWLAWFPLIFTGEGLLRTLGTFGPAIAALILTAFAGGIKGIKKLLRKILVWKVSIGFYIFSLTGTAVIIFAALSIYRIFGGTVVNENDPGQWYLIPVIFLYVLFLSVLGEEFGWRGYLLPRLQRKMSALWSSIVVGLIWGFWHLPLFLIPGNFHQGIPFLLFVLQDVALAVIITWIYNSTKGSLLLVHIFHAASNATIGLMPILPTDNSPSAVPLYIAVALLVVFAAVIVMIYGPQNLSRSGIQTD